EVVAAIFLGGSEKIGGELPDLGLTLIDGRRDPARAVSEGIEEHGPEGILDLSDEPVLGYRERMRLAAIALSRGVAYLGADFRLDPPLWGSPLPVPTLAVFGTGKRTGKTAVAGEVARVAKA